GNGGETWAAAGHRGLAPVNSAVGGVQRSDRLPHPDDELAGSTGRNDYRRTPRGCFSQGSPDFTACQQIEGNNPRFGFSADRDNQQVTIDQGRRVEGTRRELIVGDEIPFPDER